MSRGFRHSSVGKESASNAGDPGLTPGWGRSSGKGNGNPLQYSRLENPIDRGAWQATVHGMAKVRHNLATKPPPFTGRTGAEAEAPILWPPDAKTNSLVKSLMLGNIEGKRRRG